jgi:HEAT repeat protein
VIHALGEIEGGASTDVLVSAMMDSDPELRRAAAHALGQKD